ncbi:MAG: hypothetical protein KC492_05775 [Myxococcales bacterium]|nr:hypothetical protein [Myxococcales bacterium]
MDVGLCNGLPLRGVYGNLGTLFGSRGQQQILELLPGELAEGLAYGRIIAGGWYPISWLSALHEGAQELSGSGRELARKLGYMGSKSYFRGVHKVFISFMDPGFVIGKTPLIFRKYYDTGEALVVERNRGNCLLRFSGCSGFDANLWQGLFGACEAVLELSGAKNIRLRAVSGGGERDVAAEVSAYWT